MAIVVGANGFLGRRLADELSKGESTIRVIRDGSDVDVVQLDLRTDSALEQLLSLVPNQTVYYCANVGGRDVAAADPVAAYRINATVPAKLAAAARQFVYFSTDYVFSHPGPNTEASLPTPNSVYADSKIQGERGVLVASSASLIVRVSGLYDTNGTRTGLFGNTPQAVAPDDQATAPTYVPDLIATVRAWQAAGVTGVRHAFGPDMLSHYEFQQLASLRWKFDVRPTLSAHPRSRIILQPSAGVTIRRPAEVFTTTPITSKGAAHGDQVIVLDCVGVVLSCRRWREPDIRFWDAIEFNSYTAIHDCGAERVAGAYCPNPRFWRALRHHPSSISLVLMNDGPWPSFSMWYNKYGFANIFDVVINSDRDGFTKSEELFQARITNFAAGRAVAMIDDNPDIVARAARWGWDSRQAIRVRAWPVEEYEYERNRPLWTSTQ